MMRFVATTTAAAALLTVLVGNAAQTPPTRVARERTQPPADQLLDYAKLTARLDALATSSPRVRIVSIGKTVQGRSIPMAIVSEPPFDPDALAARARAISGPTMTGRTLATLAWAPVDVDRLLPDTRLPIVVAGASWGHEAAQVEGLVEAIAALAADSRVETANALKKVVLLVVPLMNPDGREKAIAEWRTTPFSTGDSGVGNADGFMLNRDFVHQTQPESRAILDMTMKWRPVVGVDMHEDMYTLGVAIPETAFVPPFMPGVDVEEHPATRAAIARLGGKIATAWRAAGFRVAFAPEGTPLFAPMPAPGSGGLNPVAGSSGRLEFMWAIHGITSYITESGRTPGNQSWEDRVAQKRIAALTTVEAVAADPAYYAKVVYERKRAFAEDPASKGRFLVIPRDEPRAAALDELRRLLAAHDVIAYEATGMGSQVIPLAQPEGAFVRHALLAERSALNDLPSALGVRVPSSDAFSAVDRNRLMQATLVRQAKVAGASPPAKRGVVVGVLSGQGFEGSAPGEVAFVLRREGFDVRTLGSGDLALLDPATTKAVVVPDGEPLEIVNGSDPNAPNRRFPWEPAEPSRGIGADGGKRLAAFVRAGGRLILMGRSVGLALAPYTGLADVTLATGAAARPGLGQVRITPTGSERWLFRGVPALDGPSVRAFISAAPGSGAGYLFRMSRAESVAATYAGAVTRAGDMSFVEPAALAASAGWTAVGVEHVGRGLVVLLGIAPTFRAQWRATFPLLTTAISGATGE